MGWRSWNAFGNRISMDMMLEATDALVAKEHAQAGTAANVSLCDMGYCSVGIDEGLPAYIADIDDELPHEV